MTRCGTSRHRQLRGVVHEPRDTDAPLDGPRREARQEHLPDALARGVHIGHALGMALSGRALRGVLKERPAIAPNQATTRLV